MLTVDFDRLSLEPGQRLLDLGAGTGRHSFEAYRRGARVVAVDLCRDDLDEAGATLAAMLASGEAHPRGGFETVVGDATCLEFPDGSFDRVIVSEVLEHIPEDRRALAEIARVLRRGGRAAVTVPRWFPEKICWALSSEYHSNPGGHVRIYRGSQLEAKLEAAGLRVRGRSHAHAIHSPYWWLKCAFGSNNDRARLPRLYHRMLVWDIVRRPAATRITDRLLNPVLGKSLVLYVEKP